MCTCFGRCTFYAKICLEHRQVFGDHTEFEKSHGHIFNRCPEVLEQFGCLIIYLSVDFNKENGKEDCINVQPLMPSGKRIRAIPESWTSSFGKQFYAQEKSVTELQRQSEEDWMLRLEGQLFETGNKLRVTAFEELKSFITQELQGVDIQEVVYE